MNNKKNESALVRSFSSISIKDSEEDKRNEHEISDETPPRHTRKKRANKYKNKKRNSESMREQRTREGSRFDEKELDKKRKRIRREDQAFREREQNLDSKRRKVKRLNTDSRRREQTVDTQKRRHKRQDSAERRREQEVNTQKRQLKRQDSAERRREQEADTQKRQIKRQDSAERRREQTMDTERRKVMRQDPDFRETEKARDRLYQYNSRHLPCNIIESYELKILEGPTIVCVCCGGLFFKRSMIEFYLDRMRHSSLFDSIFHVKKPDTNGKYWICITCNKYFEERKLPRLALCQQLDFPPLDVRLAKLSPLEEQLCSPRIAFLRIKPLQSPDNQAGLVGNVVNVPIDVEETLHVLPRRYDQASTIQLKFMRKLEYKRSYMFEKVRPQFVKEALEYLLQQPVFRENRITLSREWFDERNNTTADDFVVDAEDAEETENEDQLESPNESDSESENISQNSIEKTASKKKRRYESDESDDEHRDSLENNEILMDSDLAFAPGEGRRPISILYDDCAEELTFLKIYGGQKRSDYCRHLAYGAVCKSEFRRYDRRCAENISKIFYSYKKLVASRIRAAIDTSVSKKSQKYQTLTAAEVLNSNVIDELVANSEMKTFLRGIRSSPQYWEEKS